MNYDKHLLDYGKICWLWSNSSLHNDWTISLQARFVIPPISLEQYIMIEEDGMPVAYCSWATVNREVEQKYILSTVSINLQDWNSGDRVWLIDWVSPFSHRYNWALKKELSQIFSKKIVRAIRVKKGHDTARILTFTGSDLTQEEALILREKYYQETMSDLKGRVEIVT